MIFSENRDPLFRIMPKAGLATAAHFVVGSSQCALFHETGGCTKPADASLSRPPRAPAFFVAVTGSTTQPGGPTIRQVAAAAKQ
jgi:hypothetical protein